MNIEEAKLVIESASWSAAGQGGPEEATVEIAKLTLRVHELENGIVRVVGKKMVLLNEPNVLSGHYSIQRINGTWLDWKTV